VAADPIRVSENSARISRAAECGHGRSSARRGRAGRCTRCRELARLAVRLRQAARLADALGLELLRQQLATLAEAPR